MTLFLLFLVGLVWFLWFCVRDWEARHAQLKREHARLKERCHHVAAKARRRGKELRARDRANATRRARGTALASVTKLQDWAAEHFDGLVRESER